MQLRLAAGRYTNQHVTEQGVRVRAFLDHVHAVSVLETMARGFGGRKMAVAQRSDHAVIESYAAPRPFDEDAGRVLDVTRLPQWGAHAERQRVRLRDLDLIIVPRRPDHSDVGNAAPRADQGHRLQGRELRRLRDARMVVQAVFVAKQLFDDALRQVHVALGHRNRNSRRRRRLLVLQRCVHEAPSIRVLRDECFGSSAPAIACLLSSSIPLQSSISLQAAASVASTRPPRRSGVFRTSNTGTEAIRTTDSASLPMATRTRPRRPCVPITMRSADHSRAWSTMKSVADAPIDSTMTVSTSTPCCRTRAAACVSSDWPPLRSDTMRSLA